MTMRRRGRTPGLSLSVLVCLLLLLVFVCLRQEAFVEPPGRIRSDARPWFALPAHLLACTSSAVHAASSAATESTAATAAEPAKSPPPFSEEWMMQFANKAMNSNGDAGASLAALGVGAFILFSVVSVVKFLLAGAGGLFLVKEFDQQFGKEGRKTSKAVEKLLKRLAGEPADLLDERRLKVVRLNDEVTGFEAALIEQTSGPTAGNTIRSKAKSKRFLGAWEHVLDGLSLSAEERQKVEQVVGSYAEKERERQEQLLEARSNWQKDVLKKTFFSGFSNRLRLGSTLEKEVKLQEELLANLQKELPAESLTKLSKALEGDVDLSWLADGHYGKAGGKPSPEKDVVYVLTFDGDPSAAGVALLQKEITAILGAKKKPREVVLRLKSPGGTVTGYGLAGAQLMRFKQHGVRLVVCVDELAASGGYLMACTADKILCSPFAGIGSIGVIAGVPNAWERLEREGLKVIQTTAGKWKRTIDPFQPADDAALEKAKQDVMMIYKQFSSWVQERRPGVDIEQVATGEVWFGPEAVARGLVDELQTSAEYILQHITKGHEVLELTYSTKSPGLASSLATASVEELLEVASALGTTPQALQAALGPASQGMAALDALRAAASVASGARSDWPSGATEPRLEARGPLGMGGNYGF